METYKGKQLVALDANEPLQAGDRVLIRFKWLIAGDWYRAYQWNVIEKKIEGRSDWRVVSYRNDGDFLDAEIEVLSGPQAKQSALDPGAGITQASLVPVIAYVALTAVSIAASIIAIAWFGDRVMQWRLVEAGKIEAPVSSVAQAATGLKVFSYAALIGVGGYLVLRLFRR